LISKKHNGNHQKLQKFEIRFKTFTYCDVKENMKRYTYAQEPHHKDV